jgi:hypothetical protein
MVDIPSMNENILEGYGIYLYIKNDVIRFEMKVADKLRLRPQDEVFLEMKPKAIELLRNIHSMTFEMMDESEIFANILDEHKILSAIVSVGDADAVLAEAN